MVRLKTDFYNRPQVSRFLESEWHGAHFDVGTSNPEITQLGHGTKPYDLIGSYCNTVNLYNLFLYRPIQFAPNHNVQSYGDKAKNSNLNYYTFTTYGHFITSQMSFGGL